MSILDWVMVFAYLFVLIGIVVFSRKARTMDDFAVGSRQIPRGIILATLTATYIGPGYAMGLANKSAANGIIWFAIFLAFSLQTILVGMFVAPRLRTYESAYTLADVMGSHYGKLVKFVAGVMSVVLCAGFIGAIANASGEIIQGITGVPFVWGVIISMLIVVCYSAFGGIKTVVLTDVVQFIVLAVSIPMVFVFMLKENGMAAISQGLQQMPTNSFSGQEIVAFVAAFLLGETLVPPYANRALMSKDSGHAKAGFVSAGAFSIAWFLTCSGIGILGRKYVGEESANVFLDSLHMFLPIGFYGIAIAGMISIIMSSQSSLINAAAVSFSNDVLGTLDVRGVFRRHELGGTRLITIIIGIVAAFFAINVQGVIPALLVCYTLWAPTIVLPLIFAVTVKRVSPYSGIAAILAGGSATGLWEWVLKSPHGIPSILVGIAANIIVFWIVHFITRNYTARGLFQPLAQN